MQRSFSTDKSNFDPFQYAPYGYDPYDPNERYRIYEPIIVAEEIKEEKPNQFAEEIKEEKPKPKGKRVSASEPKEPKKASSARAEFFKQKYYDIRGVRKSPNLILLLIALCTLLFISSLFLGASKARRTAKSGVFLESTAIFASRLFYMHAPFLLFFVACMYTVSNIWNESGLSVVGILLTLFILILAFFCASMFLNVIMTWILNLVEEENSNLFPMNHSARDEIGMMFKEFLYSSAGTALCTAAVPLVKNGISLAAAFFSGGTAFAVTTAALSNVPITSTQACGFFNFYVAPNLYSWFTSGSASCPLIFSETNETKAVSKRDISLYSVAHRVCHAVDKSIDKAAVSENTLFSYTVGTIRCTLIVRLLLFLLGLLPAAAVYERALDPQVALPPDYQVGAVDNTAVVRDLLQSEGVACSKSDFANIISARSSITKTRELEDPDAYKRSWENTLKLIHINKTTGKSARTQLVGKETSASVLIAQKQPVALNFEQQLLIELDLERVRPGFSRFVSLSSKEDVVSWPTYEFIRDYPVLSSVFRVHSSWASKSKTGGVSREELKYFVGEAASFNETSFPEDLKTRKKVTELQQLFGKKIDYNRSVLPWCAFAYSRPTEDDTKVFTDARSLLR